jgi:hypothetical protein
MNTPTDSEALPLTNCSASLIPHLTFKDYNGGTMREWRIFCQSGCGGEGFYCKTKAECVEQAWSAGWRVFSGKPKCNNCLPNRQDQERQ